ncbi:iron permease [Lenzites betulinus]|nr:iron permease [Lenzites betulinus]
MENTDGHVSQTSSKIAGTWNFVFWMIFLSSLLVDMLSALDLTAVSTALPTITNSLNGKDFIWAGSAYTVTSSAVIPFIGNLVSAFGSKQALILFLTIFALGSALSGAAHTMDGLIAGRAVQGLGAGGCFSITEIIYADLVPLTERGKLQGITAAAWALACAIGPPIGGALAQHGSWRWLFFLNIPVCGIAILLNLIYLPMRSDPRHRRRSLRSKLAKMDFFGSGTLTASTVLIFLAITWGGLRYPWSSAQVLVPLVLGILGTLSFFVMERYWLKGPTIPGHFFKSRTTFGGYVGTFLHGISSVSTLYYIPVYLQAAAGAAQFRANVDILVLATLVPVAAIVTGVSINIHDRYLPHNYIGWVVIIVGFGVLSTLDEGSSRPAYLASQIPIAMGTGIVYISTQFAVLAPLPDSEVTHALAFFTFTRVVAQGWGIVVGGTILQNVLLRRLPSEFTATLPEGVQVAYAAIQTIPSLPEPLRGQVHAAFAQATRQIWLVMLGVSGAGLLSCLLLREVSMRGAKVEPQALDNIELTDTVISALILQTVDMSEGRSASNDEV